MRATLLSPGRNWEDSDRPPQTVLSQDCLGLPTLGGPRMRDWRAREWSWLGSARLRCLKKDSPLLCINRRWGWSWGWVSTAVAAAAGSLTTCYLVMYCCSSPICLERQPSRLEWRLEPVVTDNASVTLVRFDPQRFRFLCAQWQSKLVSRNRDVYPYLTMATYAPWSILGGINYKFNIKL